MNSEKKCVINTGMESMVRFPANKFEASLQHCCKMNWTAKLHVLQPTFEPVLHQIRLQGFFFLGGKTRSIAVQLILQQCCKTSRMFFVARVTVDRYWNVTAKSIMAHNKVPMTLFYWSLLGRNCQPNLFLVDSKIRYITLLQTIPVPSSPSKALFVWDDI